MNVYIMDLDYMAKEEPNFLAMRISSFHKQHGDTVTLLRPKDKLPRKIGCLYVLRRDAALSKPSINLLYHPNVHVHGIEYFNNWDAPAALLACRPDYQLYPRGRDKFERSDAVQLTDEKGHLLTVRQNDVNIETNKDCVVTDEQLWKLSNSDVVKGLNSLQGRKNIYFLYPIPLSRILDDKLVKETFLNLNFAQKVKLNWMNTLPFKRDKVDEVLEFIRLFKEKHPHNVIGNLSFYPKPRFGEDIDNIKLGLYFISEIKKLKIVVVLEKLKTRLDSGYVHYYELLHNWSMQPQLSWMELIAQWPAKEAHTTIEQYYCHPEWWYNEMFRAGIELMHDIHMDNPKWMLWQYDDKYYPETNLNWEAFLDKTLW